MHRQDWWVTCHLKILDIVYQSWNIDILFWFENSWPISTSCIILDSRKFNFLKSKVKINSTILKKLKIILNNIEFCNQKKKQYWIYNTYWTNHCHEGLLLQWEQLQGSHEASLNTIFSLKLEIEILFDECPNPLKQFM